MPAPENRGKRIKFQAVCLAQLRKAFGREIFWTKHDIPKSHIVPSPPIFIQQAFVFEPFVHLRPRKRHKVVERREEKFVFKREALGLLKCFLGVVVISEHKRRIDGKVESPQVLNRGLEITRVLL